ncbi:MAG TPA: phytoene/squalene synthase family protein, partial [Nevskiaceae bacterium]|nr:phytoene/squalene synthase family protein [Nevskiaceae bacterium]
MAEQSTTAQLLTGVRRRFELARSRAAAVSTVARGSRVGRWLGRGRIESTALAYQSAILPAVSRTFALTIPQLPEPLATAIANAYLLCRIADTIEDEPRLAAARKQHFQTLFGDVVGGRKPAEDFARELAAELSQDTPDAERELVRNAGTVLSITRRFNAVQRQAIQRCVTTMCEGMHGFENHASAAGLADVAELDRYCYYVAGVVGEMLTELFCDHSPVIGKRRDALMRLAVSFGQGLQLTNIIKDVWDDHARGVCWYPRDVFERHGFDLSQLSEDRHGAGFQAGVRDLVAIAHGHLRDALAYMLLIPQEEHGIRLFCAWAIGMAVLTLDKVNAHLDFIDGR